ncbi:hypothetical protein [Sphingomonas montanisoli]|uniref:Uncharacterized protein n=1 Tax=Sphingomonas montanisoli TaxID=2606412 RepID=A0A5D9C913_9SPHN|nr:hypothetical protein [Sphingomonas montanisoli]TZG26475.1 hypothetical protein FYJ91_16255 [Sphingomonas montanisoli]
MSAADNPWTNWPGCGPFPAGLSRDAIVEVRMRNGATATEIADIFGWKWNVRDRTGFDIVAFREV